MFFVTYTLRKYEHRQCYEVLYYLRGLTNYPKVLVPLSSSLIALKGFCILCGLFQFGERFFYEK